MYITESKQLLPFSDPLLTFFSKYDYDRGIQKLLGLSFALFRPPYQSPSTVFTLNPH